MHTTQYDVAGAKKQTLREQTHDIEHDLFPGTHLLPLAAFGSGAFLT